MKIKSFRYKTTVGIIAILYFVSGCLKDDRFNDLSKLAPTAEVLGAAPGKANAFNLSGNATDDIVVKVNVTGASAPTSDVVLTLGISQAALDMYNLDKSHVAGVLLPSNAYSIPASVTITAGKDTLGNNNRSAQFTVTLTEANIPTTPGVNYVLPIAITGAPQGYIVSGNQAAILYNFYHNPYDGDYTSTGKRYNFSTTAGYTGWDNSTNAPAAGSVIASTSPWSFTTTVITINADNSWAHIAQGPDLSFLGAQNLLVNNDDVGGGKHSVTISTTCPANDASCPSPQTLVANFLPLQGGPQSTYDPATKTFDLYYQWTNAAGTFRVCHDVMVHQ